MTFSKKFLLVSILVLTFQFSFSQERCATVQYENLQRIKNPKRETVGVFEKWMQDKLQTRRMEAQRTSETQSTYVIPVVVHIIHNGEAVGTGTNLSDAQIQSQIDVLNKDYQRMNADAANTPSEFASLAGSIDVQFVLAKQDPNGAPTNGIVRVKGTQESWSLINEMTTFKSLSYWPAENYMNVWVIKSSDSNIGHAQFPVSSLPGLEGSPDDRLTDGVVISYTAFGSVDYGNFNLDPKYNKGRTLTHEVGHFLGLRHIWGDDGSSCTGTDYVDDTPNQAGSYLNQCPTTTRTSCSSNDMYMNYMDYTNDACMNLFTKGQFGRVVVVLQNSPRRYTLLSSPGATEPVPVANDAAITKVVTPGITVCGDAFLPKIEIQNIGSNTINSLRAQLKVNNTIIEIKDVTVTLNYLGKAEVSFSSYTPVASNIQFSFEVLLVNNVADSKTSNNKADVTTTVPPTIGLPIAEVFNSIPSNWSINNPDNLKTWQLVSTSSNGNSIFLNGYDYDNQGAVDRIITPVIDLTNVSVAFLRFDRAYAAYDAEYFERLRVLVSSACDFNASSVEVFNKSGSALATAPNTTSYFDPTAAQWKNEFVSLSQFAGQKIQIAFEVTNGYGNNLYLDNIGVLSDLFVDLAIVELESPSPVSCSNTITPKVLIKNSGTTPIISFTASVSINNQTPVTQSVSNLNLSPGEEQLVTLNNVTLSSGSNTISFTLLNPNSLPDSDTSNDILVSTIVINNASDIIPYRQNFDGSYSESWSIVSQGSQIKWSDRATNNINSMAYNAYNLQNDGDESWLVSPVFNFSKYAKASMFFDVSYAYRFVGDETLKVVYSDDCGLTFKNVLYQKSGENLSTEIVNAPWVPSNDSHWRRDYIDLSELAGKPNLRFAFIATSEGGNNLYVDNIEFFIDNNPDPVSINNSFSVYGPSNDTRLTFNLKERMPVNLQIYNSIGQLMLNNQLPETLNQTYYFDLANFSTGIYIFRVTMGNEIEAVRVYLSR